MKEEMTKLDHIRHPRAEWMPQVWPVLTTIARHTELVRAAATGVTAVPQQHLRRTGGKPGALPYKDLDLLALRGPRHGRHLPTFL